MSRRSEILAALKTEIDKVSGLTVGGVMRSIDDLSSRGELPFASVQYALDRKELATLGGDSEKQGVLDVLASVFVRDETNPVAALDAVFSNIEKEIDDDPRLGKTYPVFARVVEAMMTVATPEADEAGGARYGVGEILIRVDYRHARGTP